MNRSFLLLVFVFFVLFPLGFSSSAHAVDVDLLTPQGSTVLKSWTPEMISRMAGRSGDVSAQKLIIEESTQNIDLNTRADVDLITLYGDQGGMARVPRFMIWRGFLKLNWNSKTKTLSSRVSSSSSLIVPASVFEIKSIQKIELAKHSLVYVGTELKLRTNPAASRGEKFFTQSCLACHSLPRSKTLKPEDLNSDRLSHFSEIHRAFSGLALDARAVRGLKAYSEALASEKNEVKSKK